jgi:hypothetical protein
MKVAALFLLLNQANLAFAYAPGRTEGSPLWENALNKAKLENEVTLDLTQATA